MGGGLTMTSALSFLARLHPALPLNTLIVQDIAPVTPTDGVIIAQAYTSTELVLPGLQLTYSISTSGIYRLQRNARFQKYGSTRAVIKS